MEKYTTPIRNGLLDEMMLLLFEVLIVLLSMIIAVAIISDEI